MKYLLLILSMSILLSGELEVDGDLKVTGTIQNDSLAQVILLQQQQISALEAMISQLQAQMNNLLINGDCSEENPGIQLLDVCGICGGDNTDAEDCPVYALSFDGDDYVDVSNIDAYNNLEDFTVSVEFKTSQNTNNGSLIINEGNGSNPYDFWQFFTNNGRIDFYIYTDDEPTPSDEVIHQDIIISDNQWHQAVVNRYSSDGKIVLYIDGILTKEFYQGTGTFQNGNSIKMGMGTGSSGREYIGLLDNVTYWNHILTPEDIDQISISDNGILGYWNSNTDDEPTLIDSSENENHGTIHGATWVERE